MPLSFEQFSQQLLASGLLTDAELTATLAAAVPTDDRPLDGEQLARLLIKLKKLTKFQAEQIYAGKGRSLILGNYVVLDKLGQGGMGMVLKARHQRMDRVVALKVMSAAAVKSPEAVKRFHREAQAAAKLNHPHIVAAFDADEANGTHFLVMQYVDGSDLAAVVRKNGPLPVEHAIRYIVQAARGLEYAHEQGVIHRDIKPANLLIDGKGVVRILDMGLARIEGETGGQADLTTTGAVMGTVDYMAPEQALSTKSADARSDIYSLGISLWYLLTGRAAYDGESLMAKLLAHRDSPVPSLCEVRTDVSPAVDAVFRKIVAKQAKDRYQTVTDVIRDLEACLNGESPSTALDLSHKEDDGQFNPFNINLNSRASTSATATRSRQQTATRTFTGSAAEATMLSGDVTQTDKPGETIKTATRPNRTILMAGATGAAIALCGMIWLLIPPRKNSPKNRSSAVALSNKSNKKSGDQGTIRKDTIETEPVEEPKSSATVDLDLLSLVDLDRDASLGNWTRRPDGIGCENPAGACVLQFPYKPPEEYDFEIEFTTRGPGLNVNQYLASGKQMFAWKLNSHNAIPPLYGFELLDGKFAKDLKEAAIHIPDAIQDGRRYRSTVEVRRGSLRTLLDGRELVKWTGDFKRLSMEKSTPMPHPGRLGIGSWRRPVTFHAAKVREISGIGRMVASNSPGTETQDTDRQVAEWVLSIGGNAVVQVKNVDKSGRFIKSGETLPEGTLLVTTIQLNGVKIVDADLKRIAGLKFLKVLQLNHTPVTDAGLEHLGSLGLTELLLANTAVSDKGLEAIKSLPLESLGLARTKISDAGLKTVAEIKTLKTLVISGTKVTDEGFQALAQMKSLRMLQLSPDQAVSVGIATFKRARSKCEIIVDDPQKVPGSGLF